MKMLIAVLLFSASIGFTGEPTPLETAKELAWTISVERRKLESDEQSYTTRPGEDASNNTKIAEFRDRGVALNDKQRKLDKMIKDNKLSRAEVDKVFAERKDQMKQQNQAAIDRLLIEQKIREAEGQQRAREATPPKRIGE